MDLWILPQIGNVHMSVADHRSPCPNNKEEEDEAEKKKLEELRLW